jgi:hypothetical protein
MKQQSVRLSKSASNKLNRRISNLALDETKASFEGSDAKRYSVNLESQRSLVDSSLEADLKYRLGIQDYYVGKAKLQLSFDFNAASSRQTRAREMVLHLKSMPVRLVRRLVK